MDNFRRRSYLTKDDVLQLDGVEKLTLNTTDYIKGLWLPMISQTQGDYSANNKYYIPFKTYTTSYAESAPNYDDGGNRNTSIWYLMFGSYGVPVLRGNNVSGTGNNSYLSQLSTGPYRILGTNLTYWYPFSTREESKSGYIPYYYLPIYEIFDRVLKVNASESGNLPSWYDVYPIYYST